MLNEGMLVPYATGCEESSNKFGLNNRRKEADQVQMCTTLSFENEELSSPILNSSTYVQLQQSPSWNTVGLGEGCLVSTTVLLSMWVLLSPLIKSW